MRKERFEELCDAIRQAEKVRRGEATPSRVWAVTPRKGGGITRRRLESEDYRQKQRTDWKKSVASTRVGLRLSQNAFADLLGISVKTLHNWEQGRRRPTGAARVLLRVAARHPEVILEAAA